MTIPKKKIYQYKSFYLTPSDREMLSYLVKINGSNASAVIRKLIIESYSILKYVEQKL